MQDEYRKVVILGAGISGLTCAFKLRRLDVDVLLLERSGRAGGVIRSTTAHGFLIEGGPNSVRGTPELLDLIDELGIGGEMLEGNPKAPAYVYFDGRLRAVPMNPLALLTSDLLSVGGKLRLLKEPFIPKRQSAEEESVFDFITRRLGPEVAERLVAPLVAGIYAGDANQLSSQAAFPSLADLESRSGSLFRGGLARLRRARRAGRDASATTKRKIPRSLSFRSGMGFLTDTLSTRLDGVLRVSTDCRVNPTPPASLEGPGGRFRLSLFQEGKEIQYGCDELVIAAPAYRAAEQVAPLSEELSDLLREIDYPPLAVLHLAYERSQIANPLDGLGFLVPPVEGLKVLGCLFNSTQFGNRAPENKALLTVFIGGALHAELPRLGDEELIAIAGAELGDILGITSPPQVLSVTRWDRAIPQYHLGHAARIRKIETAVRAIDGLHLIGNYLHGVSIGDCVREAAKVATRIQQTSLRSE